MKAFSELPEEFKTEEVRVYHDILSKKNRQPYSKASDRYFDLACFAYIFDNTDNCDLHSRKA